MYFKIVGDVSHVETFATGSGIREVARLRKLYGRGRWRKRKGVARVRLEDGTRRGASVRGVRYRQFRIQDQTLSLSIAMAKSQSRKRQLVVCVKNEGYEVSLELRKIYVSIEDDDAKAHRMIRVMDESGDDYLYPQKSFLPISLPQPVHRAVLTAA
jgi:hypothetical protein